MGSGGSAGGAGAGVRPNWATSFVPGTTLPNQLPGELNAPPAGIRQLISAPSAESWAQIKAARATNGGRRMKTDWPRREGRTIEATHYEEVRRAIVAWRDSRPARTKHAVPE